MPTQSLVKVISPILRPGALQGLDFQAAQPVLDQRYPTISSDASVSPAAIQSGCVPIANPVVNPSVPIDSIICGDSSEVLRHFPDESVDMVITSPPYGDLRTYNGYSFHFNSIADQVARVLKSGGVIVWNVADASVKGSKTLVSHEQALYFKNICGLTVHDVMIYEKNSCQYPARRDGNRFSNVFEYIYIFSKGKPKTSKLLCDKKNRWAGTKGFGTASKREKDGTLVQFDRKPVPDFSPRANIWRYNTGGKYSSKDATASKHPAIMPELLAFDHIRVWSNESDIVLDPMAGSGTSCVMAKVLNRRYIGIDMSEEYCSVIRQRLLYPYDADDLAARSTKQYNDRFKQVE